MALSGGIPGRSQFSHGAGMFPDPLSNFQSNRHILPWSQGEDGKDQNRDYIATKRLDATNPLEPVFPNMYYALGNPDGFGPQPALVQEKPNIPSGVLPLPKWRYGVNRED